MHLVFLMNLLKNTNRLINRIFPLLIGLAPDEEPHVQHNMLFTFWD